MSDRMWDQQKKETRISLQVVYMANKNAISIFFSSVDSSCEPPPQNPQNIRHSSLAYAVFFLHSAPRQKAMRIVVQVCLRVGGWRLFKFDKNK